jgi:ubiquinone/menaquinone biosynthesis C-methylase UbiE
MAREGRFGALRLVRDDVPRSAKLLYRLMGVADPAHYLHHRHLARSLAVHAPANTGAILDAGCGRGDHSVWLAQRFPAARVLGVDLDAARVKACQTASRKLGVANVEFELGDLTQPQRERAFDLVISIDVLEHIVPQSVALRGLYAALRPGGLAYLHVPTRRKRPVPLSRHLTAFHEWEEREHIADEASASEFAEQVRAAGFELVSSIPTFGYWTGELATSLFALFYASSTRNRILQAALAPLCRGLASLDWVIPQRTYHAVAVVARRTSP